LAFLAGAALARRRLAERAGLDTAPGHGRMRSPAARRAAHGEKAAIEGATRQHVENPLIQAFLPLRDWANGGLSSRNVCSALVRQEWRQLAGQLRAVTSRLKGISRNRQRRPAEFLGKAAAGMDCGGNGRRGHSSRRRARRGNARCSQRLPQPVHRAAGGDQHHRAGCERSRLAGEVHSRVTWPSPMATTAWLAMIFTPRFEEPRLDGLLLQRGLGEG